MAGQVRRVGNGVIGVRMLELRIVNVILRVIACVETAANGFAVAVEPVLCRSPRLVDPAEDAGITQLSVTQGHT